MIFYSYIKGTDGTNTTYIKFQGSTNQYPLIGINGVPTNEESAGEGNALGEIVTTRGNDQTINKNIILNSSKSLKLNEIRASNTSTNTIIVPKLKSNGSFVIIANDKSWTFDTDGNLTCPSSANIDDAGTISCANLKASENILVGNQQTASTVKAITTEAGGSYVQANYFVATSDRRAKENIGPLPSLLSYMRSIPVYSFNYISDPTSRSIGMMTQDLESKPIHGFNFVQQPADPSSYASLRESKLVYVLWKATQELADKVDALEARINRLEQGNSGAPKEL